MLCGWPPSKTFVPPATIVMMMITRNVILFGESGSGKSSIINMLSDGDPAPINNGMDGCTLSSTPYEVNVLGRSMTLWDTAGLDEGEDGRVPDWKAVINLYNLLQKVQNGVNLLVFVTRPRIKKSAQKNWKLFYEIICQKKVQIVMVVTGLEEEKDMDGWWMNNKETLHKYGIYPDDHACITASRGKMMRNGKHVYDEEFEESKERVEFLFKSKCAKEGLTIQAAEWFKKIMVETYETRFCGLLSPKVDTKEEEVEGRALQQLIDVCGMSKEDANELARKMGGSP